MYYQKKYAYYFFQIDYDMKSIGDSETTLRRNHKEYTYKKERDDPLLFNIPPLYDRQVYLKISKDDMLFC